MRSLPFLLALALAAAACSSGEQTGADEFSVDCESATGGQTVTSDENWSKFVEAEAAKTVKPDGCKSPAITAPTDGSTLDPAAPPQFTFQPTHASCAREVAPPVRFAGCTAKEGWLTRIVGALLLESPAQAHCAAVTGENYYLKLATSSGEVVYSAMLSVTSFTPDAAKWKEKLSSHAGEALQLTIERAVFLKGDISEGPYVQPKALSVTVKK